MFRIVIADDNTLIRMGIKSMIDWKGLNAQLVGEAKNGEEAYEILKREHPDLLITDIRMPGKDGLFLLEKIRSDFPETETIVISAYDEFNYVKQALQSGSINYILKPIDPAELRKSLIQAYSRKMKGNDFEEIEVEPDKEKIVFCLKTKAPITLEQLLSTLNGFENINISEKQKLYCIISDDTQAQWNGIYEKLLKLEGDKLIGRTKVKTHGSLSEAWNAARDMAGNSILNKKDCLLHLEISKPMHVSDDELRLLCKSGSGEKVKQYFQTLFEESLKQAKDSYEGFVKPIVQFLRLLMQFEEEKYQSIKDILDQIESDELLFFTLSEIYDVISNVISEICEANKRISGSKQDLALKAKKIIDTHYGENISLTYLADLFNVSQPYLSKIFKQEIGININSYITQVRMEKAKYLLEATDKKIFEIAQLVGYEEQNYFTKVYKKHMGVSPSDYRK